MPAAGVKARKSQATTLVKARSLSQRGLGIGSHHVREAEQRRRGASSLQRGKRSLGGGACGENKASSVVCGKKQLAKDASS